MRGICKAALGAVLGLSVIGAAEAADGDNILPGTFSGTAGFTTEYVFRGISQSDEDPAVQGSIDWSHDSGIYLGIWGSNVDFNDGDEAHVEIDLYAGITGEVARFTWDAGLIYYAYPGADDDLGYDFVEGKLAVGYDFEAAVVDASINYSPDYFADSGDAIYVQGGVSVPLPYGFGIDARLGHQWIEENENFGVPDYLDWHAGVFVDFEGFNLSLRYHDTDLKKSECTNICDARVVFAVSRTF